MSEVISIDWPENQEAAREQWNPGLASLAQKFSLRTKKVGDLHHTTGVTGLLLDG
jgi:hypothetical protein